MEIGPFALVAVGIGRANVSEWPNDAFGAFEAIAIFRDF